MVNVSYIMISHIYIGLIVRGASLIPWLYLEDLNGGTFYGICTNFHIHTGGATYVPQDTKQAVCMSVSDALSLKISKFYVR